MRTYDCEVLYNGLTSQELPVRIFSMKRFMSPAFFVIVIFTVIITIGIIPKAVWIITHAMSADTCSDVGICSTSACFCVFCQPTDASNRSVKFLISQNKISSLVSSQTISFLELASSIDYPPEIV